MPTNYEVLSAPFVGCILNELLIQDSAMPGKPIRRCRIGESGVRRTVALSPHLGTRPVLAISG